MQCPQCSSMNTAVTNTKLYESERKRIRKCRNCGHDFHTVETYAVMTDKRVNMIKEIKKLVSRL